MRIEENNNKWWFSIATAIACFFLMRWLIVENHSLFGDESAFVEFFTLGFNKVYDSESALECLKNIYFFHPTYPGGLYWLSAPFYFISDNYLFSFRLFIAVVHMAGVVVFYKIIEKISSPFLAFCGCLILMSSTFWVFRSHYYLTDGLVGVQIITTIYLFIRYFDDRSEIKLALTSIFISFCFLTKFSFIIYLLPLLISWISIEYSIDKLLPLKSFAKKLMILVLPSFLLAGPWYYNHFNSKDNVISQYNKSSFFIRKNSDFFAAFSNWYKLEISDLTPYLFFILILFIFFLSFRWIVAKTKKEIITSENDIILCAQEKYVVLSSLLYLVIVGIIIEVLGRTWIPRWNFNSYFLIILIVWTAHKIKINKKWLAVLLVPLVPSIIYIHFPIFGSDLHAKSPVAGFVFQNYYKPSHLRPNKQPTNVKKIVEVISNHNALRGDEPYLASAANFHIHKFAHNSIFKVLDFMRGNELATWRYLYVPWEVRPIEVENIFALDVPHARDSYIVLRKQNLDMDIIDDPWCKLFRILPESFWRSTEKITTIESFGRDGQRSDFEIYYLSKLEFKPEILYYLAEAAEKVDHPQYKIYQQLKKIYYGLIYKTRPVEELLTEGTEVLNQVKEDSSIPKDMLLNKKILDISEKLMSVYNFYKLGKEPDYVFKSNNMPLTSSYQTGPFMEDGSFNAFGNDPQLYFKIPIPEKSHIFNIRVLIDVPSDTIMQLFYKPPNGRYSESLSQRCNVIQGENECFFSIEHDTFDGKLRIDPGHHPGWYTLKEIAIFDSIIEK